MPLHERVTVTLPNDLLQEVDRREKNRSKLVAESVRNELDCRRREELHKSLQNPHPETAELAELGLAEWGSALPDEDAEALLDSSVGKPVRWIPEQGGWKSRSEN